MLQSLADLESQRSSLLQQFLTLGDFRPGTVSASARRCGKPSCHCAQPDSAGHPQFRLLRKVQGKRTDRCLPGGDNRSRAGLVRSSRSAALLELPAIPAETRSIAADLRLPAIGAANRRCFR
jgi:hypothetical protein